MENRFADAVVKHPWFALFFSLVVFMVSSYHMQRLIVDMEPSHNIVEDNPYRVAFDQFEHTFGEVDDIFMVVENTNGTLFSRKYLAIIQSLTTAAWQTPYSTRVDSLTNYPYSRSEQDTIIVSDLVESPETISDSELADIVAAALSDQDLLNRYITPDGHVTAVSISMALPQEHQIPQTQAVAYVRELARKIESEHPELRVYLDGQIICNQANIEVTMDDMSTIIPGMYLIIIVLLLVLTRSLAALLIICMVTMFSALSAFGTTAWLGIPVHQFSMSSINVIIAIAIANAVHLLLFFLIRYQVAGDKLVCVKESLKVNLKPVLLTCVTTAIGFLSMNLSELPPSQTLGNMVAIGVCYALFYTLVFLPAMLLILPIKPHPGVAGLSRFMGAFAEQVLKYRQPVFWTTLLLSLLMLMFVPSNIYNERWSEFIDESYQYRQDQDKINEYFGSISNFNLILDSGEPGGVFAPEYLRDVEHLTHWLRAQPEVVNVVSYSDIIKRLNRNMHADDEQFYRLPDNRELTAQYWLLYEMSLPFGMDLNRFITPDHSTTRVLVTIPAMTSVQANEMTARVKAWQQEHLPAVMVQDATSMLTLFIHIAESAMASAIVGSLWALLLISFLLVFALKSLKFGLISLVPNLLPAGIGFGVWALINGEMGMTLGAVLGITIGIVVDDTVHFLAKYLRGRRELGLSPEDAVRLSFTSTGPALLVTTLVLAAGFALMATSGYKPNSDVGLLTAIVILIAFVLDFLLLPTLLLKFDKGNSQSTEQPSDDTQTPAPSLTT